MNSKSAIGEEEKEEYTLLNHHTHTIQFRFVVSQWWCIQSKKKKQYKNNNNYNNNNNNGSSIQCYFCCLVQLKDIELPTVQR